MKVERKKINKNLPKKGFVKEADNHHIYFHHHYNGLATGAYTYISHSKKICDYSGKILTNVRKQLELDSNLDVLNLVNCPMKEDEYNEILRQKGLVPDDSNDEN